MGAIKEARLPLTLEARQTAHFIIIIISRWASIVVLC